MDPKRVDELVRRFAEALPAGARELRQELESMLRALLNSTLSNLNLVTREEFEVQSAVLVRTRAKLEVLESQVAVLEQQLGLRPTPPMGPEQGAHPLPGEAPIPPGSVPPLVAE